VVRNPWRGQRPRFTNRLGESLPPSALRISRGLELDLQIGSVPDAPLIRLAAGASDAGVFAISIRVDECTEPGLVAELTETGL
jgi:hypothetical protein